MQSSSPRALLLAFATVVAPAITTVTGTPLPAQPAEQPDDGTYTGPPLEYKEAWKKFQGYRNRKSLMKRIEGRMLLAHTKDPRALSFLAKQYAKAEEPRDQVRYLLVGIILRYFADQGSGEELASWRSKNKKARDAWLWFRTLELPWMASNRADLLAIASAKGNVFLRAAALEALAGLAQGDGKSNGAGEAKEQADLADTITGILAAPPGKAIERSVLTESCAAVLLARKEVIRSATWKPVCTALIRLLEEPKLGQRSKLAISRHLARLFDCANFGFEARLWLSKLEQAAASGKTQGKTTAEFFGVASLGTRICYVIDASDSMLKRVSKGEKDRLAVLTGSRKGAAAASGGPVEKRLPWEKIHTRFDVAREYLKLSLADLDKSKRFTVILFGDEAVALDATPKLVAASSSNVRKAIVELDRLEGKVSNNPQRPHGILRGQTNMHAGLLQAFRMTRGKLVAKDEYVNPKTFTEGCDTIYLLSDGEPSWDSYGDLDSRDPEDGVVDPESGRQFQSQQRQGFYWGPYGRKPHGHMIEDFQRLNLFRKVEIHCVGIGEADHGLLDKIGAIGLGRVVKITPPK